MAVTSTATSTARARSKPASVLFKPAASKVQKASASSAVASKCKSTPSSSIAKAAVPLLSASAVTSPEPLSVTRVPSHLPSTPAVTDFQRRVYAALLQIPQGNVATYAGLAAALHSAPRAVGGALRRNPWAPQVPCHRVVKNDGYIGGFMGDMHAAPSGVNCQRKLQLLAGEGVFFDAKGFIKDRTLVWDGFKAV